MLLTYIVIFQKNAHRTLIDGQRAVHRAAIIRKGCIIISLNNIYIDGSRWLLVYCTRSRAYHLSIVKANILVLSSHRLRLRT